MNKKLIVVSILVTALISFILSLERPYRAFGGEDMLLLTLILYWIYVWIDTKQKRG